jgi:hypothetical protein
MPPITRPDVRELASRRGTEAVISCYLDVDGRRFVRQQDLERELDQLFRRVRPRVGGKATLQSDLSRIQAYVRRGVDRSRARGLAFFACGAEQLFEVVPLPVSVPSHVVVGSAPAVGPLQSAIEDHERVAALLVYRQRARLLVVDWGEVVERSELIDALPRGLDGVGTRPRGDSRAAVVAASTSQHIRNAAQAAWELFQRSGFERLVLAGPDEVVVEVERQLHPYLRERVVGRLTGLAANASPEDVRRATIAHGLEAERRKEADLVARLREEAGAGRRAVVGLQRTLGAVHHHRADVVVASHGFAQPGWRCGGCGCLAVRGRGCPCGTEMVEVDDVVAEALDDALAQRARVEICVGNADLDVLGRIGAFLRF